MTQAPSQQTAIVVAPPRPASRLAQVTGFTDQQISLIAQTVAPGANRLELAWFLYNARRLGLEPTLKQIHFIKYKPDAAGEIVVGIDGYRAQAESSGVYAGSDDPVYEYQEDGQPKGAPSKATVTVWKLVGGQRMPFTASARWKEFYPGEGPIGAQYRKRPHNQLAVRAESHALRKAFPYQTAKLDAHAKPPDDWEEAARLDDAAREDPALAAQNARRYDSIFGSDEDGTSFADLPSQRARDADGRTVDTGTGEILEEGGDADVPASDRQRGPDVAMPSPAIPPRAAVGGAPVDPKMVTAIDDPLYQSYAERAEEAAGLGVEFEVIQLPMAVVKVTQLGKQLTAKINAAKLDAAKKQREQQPPVAPGEQETLV